MALTILSKLGKDHPFTLYVLEDRGIDPKDVLDIYNDPRAEQFVVRVRGYNRRRLNHSYIQEIFREWRATNPS